MITQGGITLFHALVDPVSRENYYQKSFFEKVSIRKSVTVEKRMSKNAPWADKDTVIRIPTEEEIAVSVGDWIVFGECTDDLPPAGSLQVSTVSDNRLGSKMMRHFKVACR